MTGPAHTTPRHRARRLLKPLAGLLTLTGLLSAGPGTAVAQVRPASAKLLVPAYFYPSGTTWQDFCQALHRGGHRAVLIMNPDNGPGGTTDPNYVRAVSDCQQKYRHTVIGYVATTHGRRPFAAVRADIDRYARLYPARRGIFLDEMATDPASKAYYRRIFIYIKRQSPGALVVGNPGTAAATSWQLAAPSVADVVVIFEGAAVDYVRWTPPSWSTTPQIRRRLGHLVHSVTPPADFDQVCAAWRRHPSGYMYVTGDRLPNPWDTPSPNAASESCLTRPAPGNVGRAPAFAS